MDTHPTDQTLSAYGLGKLDATSAEAVNSHLEQCPDCRKRVAEMSSDSFLDRVRDAQDGASQSRAGSTPRGMARPAPVSAVENTLSPILADHPDYEIKKELGRGGMGVVYLAHNRLMGRDEVLKVMSKHLMDRPGVLDRFLREIRAVARLRHPNIVTAYAATRLGEDIVFAMEYVEGLDLSQMVKAKGPLPVGHACNFVYQAALGLQHAYEEGLVHRDIKPANLMLSRKGDRATVKVLDFGLAKVARERTVDSGLTSEGQALGTPDFIAPEQIVDAQSADIRADLYSLGGTLFYLLTGRPPFQANSLYDIYQAHISRDADPLNLVRPAVPPALAAVVARMMAKDPGRRFQTPSAVAEALAPFFKKGSAAFKTPATDVPRDVEAPSFRPAEHGPAPTPTETADRTGRELRWESLIELPDDRHSLSSVSAVDGLRTPPRSRRSAALAASLLGLVALGVVAVVVHKAGRATAPITVLDGPPPVTVERKPGNAPPSRGASETGSRPAEPADVPPPTTDVASIGPPGRPPTDSVEHRGKHFKVFARLLTWHEARKSCEAMGGRLAVVRDEEEARLLTGLARSAGVEGAWLGATDEDSEGRWVWVDGTPVQFNNWDAETKQPGGRKGREHYLVLLSRRDGKWSNQPDALIDGPAKDHPGFVCEWPSPAGPTAVNRPSGDEMGQAPTPPGAGPRLVATFLEQQPDTNKSWDALYYANGHTDRDDVTWWVNQGVLVKVTPDPSVPGGSWVVTGRLAPDGKSYRGWNQFGTKQTGAARSGSLADAGRPGNALQGAGAMSPDGRQGKLGASEPGLIAVFHNIRQADAWPSEQEIYADGSVRTVSQLGKRQGTWWLNQGVLIMMIPDPQAPGESWVNTYKVAPDGQSYRGWNQLGSAFTGTATSGSLDFAAGDALAAKPARATLPPAPVFDLLQPGSVWVREPGGGAFTVLARQGRQFRARFEINGNPRELFGTVQGDKLLWLARDVRAFDGSSAADNQGVIQGDKVAMTSYDAGGRVLGSYALRLVKRAPAGPIEEASPAGGGWKAEGGELVQTSLGTGPDHSPFLFFGDPSWSSYDFSFEVLKVAGDAGFVTRFHARARNHLEFGLGRSMNKEAEMSYLVNDRWGRSEGDSHKEFAVVAGRWYAVKVEVRQSAYRCYLDGEPLFEGSDPRFASGKVGFLTSGTAVRIRNINVKEPGGRVLFSGVPTIGR